MKSTGIIRKVDDLGRIVLPIELRRSLGIGERDPRDYVQEDLIVLRKSSWSAFSAVPTKMSRTT